MIVKKIIYIISIIFVIPNILLAQSTISNLKISPLNRLNISFQGNIAEYTAVLSNDKKHLEITFPNTEINSTIEDLSSTGIITEVLIKKSNNNVIVNIKLNEARGYTILKMAMTDNLLIEVFDWNKLKKNEEYYRNSLLAIEDNIYDIAYSELQKINKKENANATGVLGLLQLKSGNINKAKEDLILSASLNSNLPDVYSALAQIYKKESNAKQYNFYIEKLKEFTGKTAYKDIEIASININPNAEIDTLTYLNSSNNIINDSNNLSNKVDSISNLNTIAKDSLVTKKENSIFNNKILVYIIFTIIIVSLMLFTTFLKWRKKQLEMYKLQNELNKKKNINKTTTNTREYPNKNIYEKMENSAIENQINNTTPVHPALKKYLNNESKNYSKINLKSTPQNKDYKENQKEVLDFVNSLINNHKNKKEIEVKLNIEKTKYKKNPNLDLALSLQKKQQDIKSEKISTINEDSNINDLKGISSITIDTKKKINKLEENKSEIEKLAEKINKNL